MHSRAFGMGVAAIVTVCAVLFYLTGNSLPLAGDKGLALPTANEWFGNQHLSFAASIIVNGAIVFIMLLLNKVYNVFRSISSLNIALFAAMQLATPDLLTQFYTGTMLALIVPLCLLLLFNCYRAPTLTRHIFLIFLLLSFFTATQYCYGLYAIAFMLGIGQMRIFNARSIIAALLGIITPWWIMIGFGIISISDIAIPSFVSVFSVIDHSDTLLLLTTMGLTAFAMILCFSLNLLKTIAYNARARAINGSFTVISLLTIVCACADYRNIVSYIPMLNFCASMEITHYFSTHRGEKSFIPVLILLASYAVIFACQIAI